MVSANSYMVTSMLCRAPLMRPQTGENPAPGSVISGPDRVSRDDRFFPLEFQRRVARERLGTDIDVVPGGHLAALSRPAEPTDQLIRYVP